MSTREERMAAAREETNVNLDTANGNKSPNGDYILMKQTQAQVGTVATNSVTIKNRKTGTKYGISVTSLMLSKDAICDDSVLELQDKIANFLKTVHVDL
jgi:hypothetical protein